MEKADFIRKLETEELRQRLRDAHDTSRLKLGQIHTKEDPYWMECFRVERCRAEEYVGKTIAEIARMRNTDALEVLFDLLVEDPETIWVQFRDKRNSDEAIAVFLRHPLSMPCTDMEAYPAEPEMTISGEFAQYGVLPAPLAYGLYPHYIGTFVREKGILSLEEAVKKATYLPAQRFRLKNRGTLRPGAYADIVVFDLDTIQLKGDFMNPALPPDGIDYVIINGKVVYTDTEHTGIREGKVLRRDS
jgi:N-acyl-D-amino-acid deacylase